MLVKSGFTEVTGNNPNLLNLAEFYVAGDVLRNADESLVGGSGLVLSQLIAGGELIGDVYKQILSSNTMFGNTDEGNTFDSKLKTAVEGYRRSNLLHQDVSTVHAAINK